MQQLPPPVRVVEALLQYEPDSTSLIQDSCAGSFWSNAAQFVLGGASRCALSQRHVDDFREYAELDEESLNFLDLELSELYCTGLPNLY